MSDLAIQYPLASLPVVVDPADIAVDSVAENDPIYIAALAFEDARAKYFTLKDAFNNHVSEARRNEFIGMIIDGGADADAAEKAWEVVRDNLVSKYEAASKECAAAAKAVVTARNRIQDKLSDFTGLSLNDIVARCVEYRPADDGKYDVIFEAMTKAAAFENAPVSETSATILLDGRITCGMYEVFKYLNTIVCHILSSQSKDRKVELTNDQKLGNATTLAETFNTALYYHMDEDKDKEVHDWFKNMVNTVVTCCARFILEQHCEARMEAVAAAMAADAA